MTTTLYDQLERRILLLDGGFGTMVQGYGLQEEDYRGRRFAGWPVQLKGCNDLLALTRPDVVREIHEKYLRAGADIIETDSFNANAVSLADYRLEECAYEISKAAAGIARSAADEFTARNPQKPRFVAGSVGPTNRTASMSADVQNPAAREVTFAQLVEAYTDQVRGLVDGGADILLVETVFDTLNAKAALWAIDTLCERLGRAIPVMVSGTLADASGRTLSGQTVEAFAVSVSHANLLSVGLNCAYGAKQLLPYLERLAAVAGTRISAHPNAGLPNVMGGYDETPEMFAGDVGEYMRRGLVNIVGGCCGTTPAHIFELSKISGDYAPRPVPAPKHITTLSGLEPLRIVPEANFINVGERTNVAGSARFARLIREANYEEALSVARAQVDAGAQIVDVCMDDGLIDGPAAMRTFLNLMASEPEIARVPVMIDSSKWEVLQAGLEVTQGKSVVNSISLKEGEAEFLRRAAEIHRFGASAVVMLFDERGQADTFERKAEVAERAYKLLTDNGFPPEDIIFDPNVLAVATGIAEHDGYAKAFIDATRWIKEHLPHAKVSGGVSNLSFAFRGNNTVREAMHSAFLYHAIRAGMDMGIVNPQMLKVYSQIEPELLCRVEDVILCRRADAAERLAEYAHGVQQTARAQPQAPDAWRAGTLGERIAHAMLKGVADYVEQDALEGYEALGSPMAVIDTLLMPAMEQVGTLFGEGKMFLPQVVKTARVMKRAVAALTPYIEQGSAANAHNSGKVLIATVKGDVHDIGKNIVAVVMACNGYEIRDLGVMVEPERIVEEAVAWGAQCICLSGLITPSLDEMARVCEELERRGLRIPVIIGGATTSDLHTAVKIAPVYSGVAVHSANASRNSQILAQLLGPDGDLYADKVKADQQALREEYARRLRERDLIPIAEARRARRGAAQHEPVVPLHTGRMVFPDFDVADAEPYIDWSFFFAAWGLKGRYPEILDHPEKGAEARKVFADAQALLARIRDERLLTLQGVAGIFPARSEGDDILVTDAKGREKRLPMLRNQTRGEENLSLADFIAPDGDWIGCFALTAGIGLKELAEKFRAGGDDYSAIMAKLLADRLTEAFAEAVHAFMRREMWGYETGSPRPVPRPPHGLRLPGLARPFAQTRGLRPARGRGDDRNAADRKLDDRPRGGAVRTDVLRRRLLFGRDHRRRTAARLRTPPRNGGRNRKKDYTEQRMNVVEIINEAIASGRTRFAFELLPPLKGDGMQKIFAAVEPLMALDPAYVNITFHREGIKETEREDGSVEWHVVRRRPGTVGISAAIQNRYGVEVVPHLICGGLSKYDIEDTLIDMDFLGLHNVLALRGDKSQNEKRFMPHPQGHAHAVDLVRQIADMNRGKFIDGEVEECHHSKFSIGVAGYPEVHAEARDITSDIARLRDKVDAGAEYVITQMFFDNAKYFDFVRRCREAGITVPIIPGIKPLSTLRHLEILPETFGVKLPEELVREVKAHPDGVREVGTEWAIAQSRELMAAGVPVLHYYTMSRTTNIQKIVKAVF